MAILVEKVAGHPVSLNLGHPHLASTPPCWANLNIKPLNGVSRIGHFPPSTFFILFNLQNVNPSEKLSILRYWVSIRLIFLKHLKFFRIWSQCWRELHWIVIINQNLWWKIHQYFVFWFSTRVPLAIVQFERKTRESAAVVAERDWLAHCM